MDHLWNNFLIKETGEGEMCMYSSDEDRNNTSSDDEMDEIEQALLQRIHYAEDFDEDMAPSQEEGNHKVVNDSKSVTNHEGMLKIIVKPVRKTEGKSSNDKDLKGKDNQSEKEETVKRRNVQESSKIPLPRNGSHSECLTKATELTPKSHSKLDTNYDVIVISSTDRESDSDTESKYKVIGKKSSKSTCKLEKSEKQCVVSISSDEGVFYIERGNTSKKLDRTELHVTPIIVLDSISDSDSSSNSDVIMVPVNCSSPGLMSQEDVRVRKRHWNKPKEDPENMAPTAAATSQKVKLKRTCIDAELRTLLDSVKEISSDDSSSDVMVIESHSEDEALDVHCNSSTASRNAYSYNQEYSYKQTCRGRYYQEPRGWPGFKCFNCLQFGHATRDCRKPKQRKDITCVLCGTKGHNDAQCPDALCYICSESGHQARECPNKKDRYATCRRCSMTGHREQRCPDRWRQYHITTEPGEIKHYKAALDNKKEVAVNGKMYCYNCSQEGHFGHECWKEPMDRYTPLISPYVVKYDYIPKRFWNIQVNIPESPVNCQILDQMPSAAPMKEKLKSKKKRLKQKQAQAALLAVKKLKKNINKTKQELCAQTAVVHVAADDGGFKTTLMSDKKQKKSNKKRRKEQREQAQTAADNGEIKPAPMPDKKQKMKNKKRKKQYAFDNETGDAPQAKKCRKMTKKEVAEKEKMPVDLLAPTKKERRKMKKDMKQRRRKGLLDQEEVLEDYEETEDYVRKGGHVLRKRKATNRATTTAEPEVQNVESQAPRKKKKRGLWKKQRLKLLRQNERQQKQDQQQQQQEQKVVFQPKLDQFLKLDKKFNRHTLDSNHTTADTAFSNTLPSMDPRVATAQGGRKNKKKRPRQRNKFGEEKHDRLSTNFLKRCTDDDPNSVLHKPTPSERMFRSQKKRYYVALLRKSCKEQPAWDKGQEAPHHLYVSDRGFNVQPNH